MALNKKSIELNEIPQYKIIPGTSYLVDYFKNEVIGCTKYFLSHLHADHYTGLRKSFSSIIYCSETTASLLKTKIKIPESKIFAMKMYETYFLEDGASVLCIEADHCPGAVCFVFYINSSVYLHTGDFRASKAFYAQPFNFTNYDFIFLDNTYEGFRNFDPQNFVIQSVFKIIESKLNNKYCVLPLKYCFVFATYSVGKEKLFLSVAHRFNYGIRVSKQKMDIFNAYSPYTTDKLNRDAMNLAENTDSYEESKIFPIINKDKANITENTDSYEESKISPIINKNTANITENTNSYKKDFILQNKDTANITENTNSYKKDFILQNKDTANITENNILPIINEDKANITESIDSYKKSKFLQKINKGSANKTECKILPFERITTDTNENQIIVISMFQVNKKKLNEIFNNLKADRIVVFCGTGWENKVTSFDWHRKDGRIIKKGIEVIYVPYSEHSSNIELIDFKERFSSSQILNTVKNRNMN